MPLRRTRGRRTGADYHIEVGYRLGSWVSQQRTRRPAPDRAARLEALPGWTWDVLVEWWEEGFECLRRFVELEGHARVPRAWVMDGFRLGQWVQVQRSTYATGQLAPDRVDRLKALPGWIWNARVDLWEEGFNHLRNFVEREGHARVPTNHVESGYRLGQWVGGQRTRKPTPDRVARLEALPGWIWNAAEAKWEEGFEHLCHFVEREGHARIPARCIQDDYRLGSWVNGQRTDYGAGRLAADRVARLEALPGWTWDARAVNWENGFNHLCRFVEREGHARVPQAYMEDGFRLGQWVGQQRSYYGARRLAADRVARLGAVPGWTWSVRRPVVSTTRGHRR